MRTALAWILVFVLAALAYDPSGAVSEACAAAKPNTQGNAPQPPAPRGGKVPGGPRRKALTAEDRKELRGAAELEKRARDLYHGGKYSEAVAMAKAVVEIRRNALGEEHPDYAASLNNLAVLYKSMGEYADAERVFLHARGIQKKVLGEENQDYAATLSNLARLYGLMGEYAKAEPLQLQACDIRKKVLGEEHPAYAGSLSDLAALYELMGEYAKAKPLLLHACDIQKRELGEEHPDYAASLNNLAVLYKSMGEYAKAEPLYLHARDICRKALGEEHPAYAQSLDNLAGLYVSTAEYARAEPLHLQARDIRKKALGEEHADYATSLNSLAVLYQSMGDYAKAEPLLLQACDIQKRELGEEHPDYAASLNNLAGLYKSMGEYAKAEPLLLHARDVHKKALGEEHADYATSLNNLAVLYQSMGEYAKAEALFRQVRDIERKVLGAEHPDYARSLNNLAGLYWSMGEYAKAEPLLLHARDVYRKAVGGEHPDHANSLNNLAVLYGSMGDYVNAELLSREAMDTEVAFASRLVGFLPEARAIALRCELRGCDPLLAVLRKIPQTRGGDAYAAVWRTRALVSRNIAQRRRDVAGSPQVRMLLARLESAVQQLAQLTMALPKPNQRDARRKRVAELNDEKERLESQLARVSTQFHRSQQVAESKPEELVRLLPRDTVAVEFYRATVWNPPPGGKGKLVAEDVYDAFVLRPGDASAGMSVAWVQLGPAGPIDEAAGAWRAAVTGRPGPHPNPLPKGEGTAQGPRPKGEGTSRPPLPPAGEGRGERASPPERFLREKVWDKIEPHLAGCSTVIIIPDAELCFLPWPALPGRKPGTCLLEDYAVATASSARQLYAALTEPQNAAGKLLLAGGVAYDKQPESGKRGTNGGVAEREDTGHVGCRTDPQPGHEDQDRLGRPAGDRQGDRRHPDPLGCQASANRAPRGYGQ